MNKETTEQTLKLRVGTIAAGHVATNVMRTVALKRHFMYIFMYLATLSEALYYLASNGYDNQCI
jgi:hypothetical protein